MEDLGNIQIEGNKFAVTSKDLNRLNTESGCHLQLVTDKVHKLDETMDDSGSETESGCPSDEFNSPDLSMKKDDRRRREYISLILNANRDPIILGQNSRFSEYLDHPGEPEDEFTGPSIEDKMEGIHRMYENVGNYEEYLKNNNFQEISPGRVYKLTRGPGVGAPPTEASLIIYNCALWTEKSKEPFDSTWLRRSVIVSNLAKDSLLPGLHELLLTTKQGSFCEAIIRPEAAFGKLGAMPRIPPNSTIFCLLEVVKVITEDKLSILASSSKENSGLTFEDYYAASDQARQRGNYFYDLGKYKTALQRYKSGIRLMEDMRYKNEVEEARAKDLLIKLYNNCARTANADGNPRLALSACKQASELDDMVPKTYWHRMTAWNNKGHFDRALGVARRAIQLFPDPSVSRQFRKAADELKIKIQKEKNEMDELHSLMGRALLTSA